MHLDDHILEVALDGETLLRLRRLAATVGESVEDCVRSLLHDLARDDEMENVISLQKSVH